MSLYLLKYSLVVKLAIRNLLEIPKGEKATAKQG